MQLTREQLEAIDAGEAVEILLDDQWCVILSKDVYEKLQLRSSGGLPPPVVGELVNQAMAEYDADDPLLDSYQKGQ